MSVHRMGHALCFVRLYLKMMKLHQKFIKRTDYFSRSWTWIKRFILIFLSFIVIDFLLSIDGYNWVKILAFLLIGILILIKPKDDIAVDEEYFYHLKTSIFRKLNKIDRYKIS